MIKELKKLLEEALLEIQKQENWADFEMPEINVDNVKQEKFGDYASNVAMVLTGKSKKNPMEIAGKIMEILKSQKIDQIEKIEVAAPGYINFFLSQKYFAELIEKINQEKEKFGNGEKNTEKVMVEYSQPNTHKEFHIGHLRNVFLGSSLVNLLRKSGQEVITANYIGDTGTHIAKCLWGLLKFHSGENLDEIKNKGEFLGKVYSEANQKLEENPEFEEEFREVQKKMNDEDPEVIKLWEKTKQFSLDDFKKIYKKLGVAFDVYFFESEEEKEGKAILPDLLKKGIVEKSQGAVIANLEKYNLGVLVLMRGDGSVLYGLKDIPLALKKFNQYKIKKSIYIIDVRQSLYFEQISKILELMGFKEEVLHIGYDFVSLKDGKSMSSRDGNIISAEFLLQEVINQVKKNFVASPDPDSIGIGAIKFFMLKYSPNTKIEFDMEKAIGLEGDTGPYVQYAHARICSILEKAKDFEGKANLELLKHEKELSLMRELNKFPELVEEIGLSYEVHKLPYYAISLADKFHSFYNACRVIDEENEELTKSRLALVGATKIVLGETLRLIGVSAPKKM